MATTPVAPAIAWTYAAPKTDDRYVLKTNTGGSVVWSLRIGLL